MLDAVEWMKTATEKLKQAFGERLLFLGLQGSRRRGDAREDSDIDIMLVLDELGVADLALYRELLRGLPQGEKACGFACGRSELYNWPAFELFQLLKETDAYYGDLKPLLPPVAKEDIAASARINAANLYHATAHLYVAGDERTRSEELKACYKGFFFIMQVVYYLRHGQYPKDKKELSGLLQGEELDLLRLGMDADYYERLKVSNPDLLFDKLLKWAGGIIKSC